MGKGLFLFCVFLCCAFNQIQASVKQKICLNMIVKNESQVIERCLASVKPYIDYWVIVDTGSTDGTQEIIRKYMKDLPGELYERPWVNFAHNRNEALQFAKNKGDYLLFIDADEELKFNENFSWPFLDKDSYVFRLLFNDFSYTRTQLVNNHLDWKWKGAVHEIIESDQAKTVDELEGVINFVRREGCRSQDKEAFAKDVKILEEILAAEPQNSRYVFYLAQSYNNVKNHSKALEMFQKRAGMGGCDQEVFFAKYAIGKMQEFLNFDTETITKSYCDAYVFRPIRAEPLYRLARLYRERGNHFLGYVFSSLGLTLSIPKTEGMLVEPWIYDYGLFSEFYVCAYALGKYDECLKAFDRVLSNSRISPDIRKCIEDDRKTFLASLPIPLDLRQERY